MDKMRKAFEAWADGEKLSLEVVDEFYASEYTHCAWQAWQAATMAEREECAKICDEADEADMTGSNEAAYCAKAIRSRTE